MRITRNGKIVPKQYLSVLLCNSYNMLVLQVAIDAGKGEMSRLDTGYFYTPGAGRGDGAVDLEHINRFSGISGVCQKQNNNSKTDQPG